MGSEFEPGGFVRGGRAEAIKGNWGGCSAEHGTAARYRTYANERSAPSPSACPPYLYLVSVLTYVTNITRLPR